MAENFYNSERRLVVPDKVQRLTADQAAMLERMNQPIHIPDAQASQSSATQIDVSDMFKPLPIKEQFSPPVRAAGVTIRALPFVIAALMLSGAGAWILRLAFVEWLGWLAVLILIIFVVVNHQENTYSAVGLALKHEGNAIKALDTIVASNERVSMAKLENDDKAHAREINLRREGIQSLIKKLGEQ